MHILHFFFKLEKTVKTMTPPPSWDSDSKPRALSTHYNSAPYRRTREHLLLPGSFWYWVAQLGKLTRETLGDPRASPKSSFQLAETDDLKSF